MRYEYRALPGPLDHIVDVRTVDGATQFVVAVPEHEHDAIANLARQFIVEILETPVD